MPQTFYFIFRKLLSQNSFPLQVIVVKAPWINHFYISGTDTYILPRMEEVVLGGTHQVGMITIQSVITLFTLCYIVILVTTRCNYTLTRNP